MAVTRMQYDDLPQQQLTLPRQAGMQLATILPRRQQWEKSYTEGWPMINRVEEAEAVLLQLVFNWKISRIQDASCYQVPTLGQLFGSGKTVFVRQLFACWQAQEFETKKQKLLEMMAGIRARAFVSKVDEFIKNGVVIEVGKESTLDQLLEHTSKKLRYSLPEWKPPASISEVFKSAVEQTDKPLLFFFDDLAADEQLLDSLCNLIVLTYGNQNTGGPLVSKPLFGFIFAGRTLGELQLSKAISMRLQWILLSAFSSADVGKIVTSLCANNTECPFFSNLRELVATEECRTIFACKLHEASGGIALHLYQILLGVYEAWKAYDVRDFDFLFDACFYSLTSIKGKYPYFEFPLEMEGQQKLSALIFLAITEKGFSPEQKVPLLGSRQATERLDILLGEFPVSITRHTGHNNLLRVVVSGFQLRFILSAQPLDMRMAVAAPLRQCVSASKLAETVALGAIVLKYATNASVFCTWDKALHCLAQTKACGCMIPSSTFGYICPNFQHDSRNSRHIFEALHLTNRDVKQQLLSLSTFKASDIGWFFDQMDEGYYIFREEFHSSTTVVVRSGDVQLRIQEQVLSIQFKFCITKYKIIEGDINEFTYVTLGDEIGKIDTSVGTVLLIFTRDVGANLIKLCRCTDGALVLKPGKYHYSMHEDYLICEKKSKLVFITPLAKVSNHNSDTRTITYNGISYSFNQSNYDECARIMQKHGAAMAASFCEAVKSNKKKMKTNTGSFTVHANLEVVILHPNTFEKFVTPEVFRDIEAIATSRTSDDNIFAALSLPIGHPTQFSGQQEADSFLHHEDGAQDENVLKARVHKKAKVAKVMDPLFVDLSRKIDLEWMKQVSAKFLPGLPIEKLQSWVQSLNDQHIDTVGVLSKVCSSNSLAEWDIPAEMAAVVFQNSKI